MTRTVLPFLALFAATVAVAEGPSPADLYSYRTATFGSIGNHMKAMGLMVKGKVPANKDDLVAHATALHQTSLTVPHLFPAGTGPDVVPETESLPKIWQDWAGFEAKAKALQDESAKLVAVAQGGDVVAFKAQFGAVGKTCGGCHDAYRLKKD